MKINVQKMSGSPCLECERNGRKSDISCGYTLGILPACDLLTEFVKIENERRKKIREREL
jgi:hypothetical protein